MWRSKRDIVHYVVVATIAIVTLVSAVEENVKQSNECDQTSVISDCGVNERCVPDLNSKKYHCTCLRYYFRPVPDGPCVPIPTTAPPRTETTTGKRDDTSGSSGSSVAVGLLVPTFLILVGIAGFCIARRYRILPCRRNIYGNVLVTGEDDDDDPPIA